MRVFVLCTGRSGSKSLIKACSHISNFTSAHESKAKVITERLEYPDNHIEADNRLSWFLGGLDSQFGDDAIYIHLLREKEACVDSFNNRWDNQGSIINAFTAGVLLRKIKNLDASEKREAISLYYDAVNENISTFLKDKSKTRSSTESFRYTYEYVERKQSWTARLP